MTRSITLSRLRYRLTWTDGDGTGRCTIAGPGVGPGASAVIDPDTPAWRWAAEQAVRAAIEVNDAATAATRRHMAEF